MSAKKQTVDVNEIKEIFEQDDLELAYRYKAIKGLDENTLVVIQTKQPYETWVDMYNESSKDQDLYNFIIDNLETEAVHILTGEAKDNFLDEHSNYDTDHQYKTECIKKVLDYNNLQLEMTVTAKDIAILLENEMFSYGSVKGYVLSSDFMERLIQDNLIDLTLKSPF